VDKKKSGLLSIHSLALEAFIENDVEVSTALLLRKGLKWKARKGNLLAADLQRKARLAQAGYAPYYIISILT